MRGLVGYKQPSGQEIGELCRFMLAQDDLVMTVTQMTLFLTRDFTREGDMKALEFADHILGRIDAPNPRILAPDNVMVNPKLRQYEKTRFKAAVVEARQQIVRKYPDLERTLVKPWDDIQELIDVAGALKGIHRLVRPIVHDGAVYVVGMGGENGKDQFIQLLRFSLADGKKSELGKVALEHRHSVHSDINFEVGLRSLFGRGACIHDGRYYLGSASHGIFIFPLDAGKVERLTTKTGLPSDHVHDLACIAGKLFAGLGEEGRKATWRPSIKTHECKVVASSRRKEKLSRPSTIASRSFRRVSSPTPRNCVLFCRQHSRPLRRLRSVGIRRDL